MKALVAMLSLLSLTACGRPQAECVASPEVRVSIDARTFRVPTRLRPAILGVDGEARLPSRARRDAHGGWAYCQDASEPPARATSISFRPSGAGLKGVDLLIIGRPVAPKRLAPSAYPTHEEAGFEVTPTKGPIHVFSPAGRAWSSPVGASCMPFAAEPARGSCRVSFVTRSGAAVTFDLRGEPRLAEWPRMIAAVDAYVSGLEARD